MISSVETTAVDEGLSAFVRAISLMRKHPAVLGPFSTLLVSAALIVGGLFVCCMFFGKQLSETTLALMLLSVGTLLIFPCVVIEMLTTVVIAAKLWSGQTNVTKDARKNVKQLLLQSFKVEAPGTILLAMGIAIAASGAFFAHVFADVALGGKEIYGAEIGASLFCCLISVSLSTLAGFFTIVTARYVVVDGMRPSSALMRAREEIQAHRSAFLTAVFLNFIMGFAQALLAFITMASRIQRHDTATDILAIVVSLAIFAILWIVQILPYVALTEHHAKASPESM